ncbi:MAG: hypothetical protein KBT36_09175 [Kurthia sp.]|nr:hypothetical protein [Candidatus Kurthia equi]
MKNNRFIKKTATLILGATLITAAIPLDYANAASKYKLKNGALVKSKTGGKITGYIVYKNELYKKGKKYTGTYKGAYYAKGKKKVTTGRYNNAYYVSGKKKVKTGRYNNAYYVNGVKKVTTGRYNNAYYVKGVKKVATGTYNNAYYVKGVKTVSNGLYSGNYYKLGRKSTGVYNGVYYENGVKKVSTGLYKGAYYVKGVKKVTTGLYLGEYYVKGVPNKGYAVYKKKLYNGAQLNKGQVYFDMQLYQDENLNKGYALYKKKLYNDDELNTGYAVFEKKLYFDENLNKELVLFEDFLYDGENLSKGLKLFSDQLYENGELSIGLKLYKDNGQELYYYDGDLADGLYEIDDKEEVFEEGVKQPAKVLAVDVMSSKQIKITFNKSIKESTLSAKTIKIQDARNAAKSYVSGYKLSADKKSVTVLFDSVLAGDYIIKTTDGIETIASEKVNESAESVEIDDKLAPTFMKKTQEDARTFQFHFSEILEGPGKIIVKNIDGRVMALTDYTVVHEDEIIQLTFSPQVEVGKNITIEFSEQTDEAGNVLANPLTQTVQLGIKNGVSPVVRTITPIDAKHFTIEFSEPVLGFDKDDLTVQGSTVKSIVKSADSTIFTVELATGVTGNIEIKVRQTETVEAKQVAAYTDMAGDPGKAYSGFTHFITDIISPKVTANVTRDYQNNEQLVFEIDEDVELTSSTIELPAILTQGSSVPMPGKLSFSKINVIKTPASNGQVNFTIPLTKVKFIASTGAESSLFKEDKYTVDLPAGLFKDTSNNVNEAKTGFIKDYIRGDDRATAKPSLQSSNIKASTTKNGQYTVEFDNTADLDVATLANPQNYRIEDQAASEVAVISSHKVIVTVPENSLTKTGEYNLEIDGIQSQEPSKVKMEAYRGTLHLTENRNPLYSQVKVTATTNPVAGVSPKVSSVKVVYGIVEVKDAIEVEYKGFENGTVIMRYNSSTNKFEYTPGIKTIVGLYVKPIEGKEYFNAQTYAITLSNGNPGEGFSPGETKVQMQLDEDVLPPVGLVYNVSIGNNIIANLNAVVINYEATTGVVTFVINKKLMPEDFTAGVRMVAESTPIKDLAGNPVLEGQGIEIKGTN